MPQDSYRRELRSLRISVTDRCNFRCGYCMPERDYLWLPRESLLRFEEIERLAVIFARLGVRKVRLTGGEPTLRKDLDRLVGKLAGVRGIDDLALTTNGSRLHSMAGDLRAAGLHRVTVSLDTLRPGRYERIAGPGRHRRVLDGIAAAAAAGFRAVKINTVVVRGFNDDEVIDLVEFGRRHRAEVRFIEYMDVGGATRWSRGQVVSKEEILSRLAGRLGPIRPLDRDPAAPAERFELADGTPFGIIASVTAPFCGRCDRARLTADGQWFLCLYASQGVDLRTRLRSGATDREIGAAIAERWRKRDDRGAERRARLDTREILAPVEELKRDPHLEMHTRGG